MVPIPRRSQATHVRSTITFATDTTTTTTTGAKKARIKRRFRRDDVAFLAFGTTCEKLPAVVVFVVWKTQLIAALFAHVLSLARGDIHAHAEYSLKGPGTQIDSHDDKEKIDAKSLLSRD
ncbi:hypothetical protein L596_006531 [Steinernema carpocapsae]|uniref:Uncharacterized protein n=1 Tax=Steinernema carpocapsae TaxID=34508 RepID=A0A4U8V4U3_STECR|nr:hypothetical protein L596_006531 [Steinernema carpocapsae]